MTASIAAGNALALAAVRKQHVIVLTVADAAAVDEALKRLGDVTLSATVWERAGWAGQTGMMFMGALHLRDGSSAGPVRSLVSPRAKALERASRAEGSNRITTIMTR